MCSIMCIMSVHAWGCTQLRIMDLCGYNAVSHVFIRQDSFMQLSLNFEHKPGGSAMTVGVCWSTFLCIFELNSEDPTTKTPTSAPITCSYLCKMSWGDCRRDCHNNVALLTADDVNGCVRWCASEGKGNFYRILKAIFGQNLAPNPKKNYRWSTGERQGQIFVHFGSVK